MSNPIESRKIIFLIGIVARNAVKNFMDYSVGLLIHGKIIKCLLQSLSVKLEFGKVFMVITGSSILMEEKLRRKKTHLYFGNFIKVNLFP